MRILNEDELLEMLQRCANKLLLAYDETMRPEFWKAFEKTADACHILVFKKHLNSLRTRH